LPLRPAWGGSVGGGRPTSAQRFDARVRDRPFGHCEPRRRRRSDRVHDFEVSTPQVASLHEEAMIDRAPLLRFFSPSALARHAARLPRLPRPAAVPLRPFVGAPLASFALGASQHRAPTQSAAAIGPCGFRFRALPQRCSTDFARIDAARFGRALRCSRRVAASGASLAPRGSCTGDFLRRRSATRGTIHVAWSGPFRRRSFLGFPSRDRGRPRGSAVRHACDGVRFDAFPDGARGVLDDPFAGLLPRASEVVERFRSLGPTCRFAARSVAVFLLRDRPARLCLGRFLSIPVLERRASTAAKRGTGKNEPRPKGRSIEDGSVRLLGFAFSACGPRASAFVGSRRGRDPALGFRLSQV
jgi:hypothetical protein